MEKEVLDVNQNASKSLSKVKTVFMVLSVIGAILGVILFIVGIEQYEDEVIATGIGLVISAIITFVIIIPFFNGFITIVKAAEYHNAKIESNYDIK